MRRELKLTRYQDGKFHHLRKQLTIGRMIILITPTPLNFLQVQLIISVLLISNLKCCRQGPVAELLSQWKANHGFMGGRGSELLCEAVARQDMQKIFVVLFILSCFRSVKIVFFAVVTPIRFKCLLNARLE